MKKRVLCIDHEGGYGGSSRSLFYLIQNIIKLDKDITFEVWCKKMVLFKRCTTALALSVLFK